jgi:outer membrane protein TolC
MTPTASFSAALLAVLLATMTPVFAADADSAAKTAAAVVQAPDGKLSLSLKQAVGIAVSPKGNANIQLAGEAYRQAKSRSAQARSAFLPDVTGALDETNMVRSLGQLGVSEVKLPFDLKIPNVVGPYDVVDIRASGSETLDLSSIRRYQAARAGVRTAGADRENAASAVAATAARAYLEALRTEADLEAAEADVKLAEAVLKQAQNQKIVGTGTGIEVTRQQVELSNDRQRALVVTNQRQKARFELLRTIGMPLGAEIELTSKLNYVPVQKMTIDEALARALGSRADFKAQRGHEETARLTSSSVKMERLPSITAFGDYGTTGQGVGQPLLPTREVGGILKVPVYDGGRMEARRAEAASQYRAEQIRTKDLRAQIELELREAMDSLHSAEEQMRVSNEGLALADSELTQARRRYEAGVTNGLEVTEAQTRFERERDNQIAALFNYNLARIDLGQALGDVQGMIQ